MEKIISVKNLKKAYENHLPDKEGSIPLPQIHHNRMENHQKV